MRTVILGLDAFDPQIFVRLYEQGRLPNLGRFVEKDSYKEFAVSNPPQSEVSWTSIATGLGPGNHGMFDFVHRNPQNYAVFASLLPTKKSLGATQFASPFNAKTLFDSAVRRGYQSTSLWWPATFPARPQDAVRTIPGLGTPDILGKLGVGTLLTSEIGREQGDGKIPVVGLSRMGRDRLVGTFRGPQTKGEGAAELEFGITINDKATAVLQFGKESLVLHQGEWSPIIELVFKAGLFLKIRAITRVILTSLHPEVKLYVSPLQIHPLKPIWPYGTPGGFVKETWQNGGPFLTLGWPQDTTALEENHISDEQFLALCESIFTRRKVAFHYHLSQFKDGVLGCVFDTLDRVQHMFLRDRPDVVESWYERFDQLVGETFRTLSSLENGSQTRLIVLSDHGFAPFHTKANLNRWLIDEGYLTAPDLEASRTLRGVNWQASQAYAIGLNSLYLNMAGREGQGIVDPADKEMLVKNLSEQLLAWRAPDGTAVVAEVAAGSEVFAGKLSGYGPDLFVGFARGFRASQETGLGGWAATALEGNQDHWGADHCMHASAVPGVIFSSHGMVRDLQRPSYRDIPLLATGVGPDASGGASPPPTSADEDQNAVEERLRSLGYL